MTALCNLFQRVIRVGRLSPPVFHPTMPLALRVANDEKFAIAVRQTRPVRYVDGSGTAAPPMPRFLIAMIRGPFTMGELDSFDNNHGFDAQVYSAAASASGGAADSASGGAAEPASGGAKRKNPITALWLQQPAAATASGGPAHSHFGPRVTVETRDLILPPIVHVKYLMTFF